MMCVPHMYSPMKLEIVGDCPVLSHQGVQKSTISLGINLKTYYHINSSFIYLLMINVCIYVLNKTVLFTAELFLYILNLSSY